MLDFDNFCLIHQYLFLTTTPTESICSLWFSNLWGLRRLTQHLISFNTARMGQKLVNELFKTLADGQLLWNTIIRPEHKRNSQRKHPGSGQKYSDKQTRALAYFACKPKEEKENKGKKRKEPAGKKGKEREQPVGEPSHPTTSPISFPTAASSSSSASKSNRRR